MQFPRIENYEFHDRLGEGACGQVFVVTPKSGGENKALKVFRAIAINRKILEQVVLGVSRIEDHPAILKPLDFNLVSAPYYLVTELVTPADPTLNPPVPRTLSDKVGKLPREDAWHLLHELSGGLAHLHRFGLVHCNLKPKNVLLTADEIPKVKLTDFGTGFVSGIHHLEFTDHPFYMAPEQFKDPDHSQDQQGLLWDVYSFGVLAFEVMTGSLPRGNRARKAREAEVRAAHGLRVPFHAEPVFQEILSEPQIVWPNEPDNAAEEKRRKIVEKCLNLNPAERFVDMRQVHREFERIEEELSLSYAYHLVEIEKEKAAKEIAKVKRVSKLLTIGLISTGIYALVSTVWTFSAQSLLSKRTTELKTKERHFDEQISTLETQKQQITEDLKNTQSRLSASQSNADQFLERLMHEADEAADTSQGFSKEQLEDIERFYTQKTLSNEGNGREAKVALARASAHLAKVRLALGKRDKIEQELSDAATKLRECIQEAPSKNEQANIQRQLASILEALSDIKRPSNPIAAQNTLWESAQLYEEIGKSRSSYSRFLSKAANLYQKIGRELFLSHSYDQALAPLRKAVAIAGGATGKPSTQEDTQTQLAAAGDLAKIEFRRPGGNFAHAQNWLTIAISCWDDVYEDRNNAPEQARIELASLYLYLGQVMAVTTNRELALDPLNEATMILQNVLQKNTEKNAVTDEARFNLSKVYIVTSDYLHQKGQITEALTRVDIGIRLLTDVAERRNDPALRIVASAARNQLAKQLTDASEFERASQEIELAHEKLQKLAPEISPQTHNILRREADMALAETSRIAGELADRQANKEDAIKNYSEAERVWKQILQRNPGDAIAEREIQWFQTRVQQLNQAPELETAPETPTPASNRRSRRSRS